MSASEELPFINDEPFEANGPSGVYFVSAYSDLGAESVSVTVTEARAAVAEHISGIVSNRRAQRRSVVAVLSRRMGQPNRLRSRHGRVGIQ